MMTTGVKHPQVRRYLRELDAALLALPAHKASELREQIVTHLNDAVATDSDDATVAAALAQLGKPNDLVAEAIRSSGAGDIRRRRRLRNVRLRTWIVLAGVLVIVGGGRGVLIPQLTAGSLECECDTAWADLTDQHTAVGSNADGKTQTTVPIRANAEQGFAFQVVNRTSFTQTIVGWGAPLGPYGATDFTLRFSPEGDNRGGFELNDFSKRVPVSMKPGDIRAVRISWLSNSSLVSV